MWVDLKYIMETRVIVLLDLLFVILSNHPINGQDSTTAGRESTTGGGSITGASGTGKFRITRDLVNMYCGDPFRRYHYRYINTITFTIIMLVI